MGTLSFSVTDYARRGESIQSTKYVTGGAHTTSTTASNLSDGATVSLAKGQVLIAYADEAMRIRFGGVAATASTGHYIPAGQQREFECFDAGNVSVIDVA